MSFLNSFMSFAIGELTPTLALPLQGEGTL